MNLIWKKNVTLKELPNMAQTIWEILGQESVPCLWLIGDLGSGKTTLIRTMLHQAGLPEYEPVNSPTFTYLNEYQIENKRFAHLDFYRLQEEGNLEFEAYLYERNFSGYFIEWPVTREGVECPPATHRLEISDLNDGSLRSYALFGGS